MIHLKDGLAADHSGSGQGLASNLNNHIVNQGVVGAGDGVHSGSAAGQSAVAGVNLNSSILSRSDAVSIHLVVELGGAVAGAFVYVFG